MTTEPEALRVVEEELKPAVPDVRTADQEARIRYWDEYARGPARQERFRRYYRERLKELYRFVVPPGMRVLEVGCGDGSLLSALDPAYGVGVDFSPEMIAKARQRHRQGKLRFLEADAHKLDLGEKFDFVICSDLVNELWDVQETFERLAAHCHPGTRLVVNAHSRVWEPLRRLAEWTRLVKPPMRQNWLAMDDIKNLLYLSGFEVIRGQQEVMAPVWIPLLSAFANKYLVKLWPLSWFGLANVVIARPQPVPLREDTVVSVVVPARNEEGNIANIIDRVPQMGAGTELIFVEGNSRDNTWAAIQREQNRRPDLKVLIMQQPGKGKGDAVRKGFANATGGVLMILDADLTVPPEDLPRFYEAWRTRRAEFVNGVRLVYPMEEKAMRFFNLLGNKFFSLAFSWLLNQKLMDTLCGTKVLSREAYEMIAANRSYFGDFDPFGDFDLIFGAAKYNLKIVDLPIRYRERVYGETNIQRWSHGLLLLRMVMYAMRRIKFV